MPVFSKFDTTVLPSGGEFYVAEFDWADPDDEAKGFRIDYWPVVGWVVEPDMIGRPPPRDYTAEPVPLVPGFSDAGAVWSIAYDADGVRFFCGGVFGIDGPYRVEDVQDHILGSLLRRDGKGPKSVAT